MKKIYFAFTLILITSQFIAQNIPNYVPKDGLVGYWPFNGNAIDESGNGNHGTVNGATLTSDRNGVSNSAYSFDGVNDYVNANINSINKATVSLFYNSSYPISWYPQLCRIGDIEFISQSGNHPAYIKNNHVGDLKGYPDGINSLNLVGEYGSWHHIIFIHDKDLNKRQIWIDGVLCKEGNTSSFLSISTNIVYFGNTINGKTSDGTAGFKGQLDDIAIYNRALTEQEITALYSGATNLASTKVYVDAPATVNQNDTLELSISTEALNASDNVIAFQTDITYDTTRYTFVSNNTVGTLNTKASVDLNTDKKGTIKVGYISTSALQGAGSLLKLKFKANQKVGQGIFGLSNFMYNNTDITSLKNDTVTTLDVTPPSTTITLSQNTVRKGDSLLITVEFSEKMADTPAPAFNLTGQNTLLNAQLTKVNDLTYTYWWVVEKGNGNVTMQLTQGTDLAGNPFAKGTTITAFFNVLPTLFGDIDTNTFIRAYDAALALQYSVGLNPLPTMDPLPWSNWRIAVANVDTIGNVTANDAAFILKHSIGKITEFPADTKKRGGDAPKAEVTVAREGNQLVFRATGTLYGFNVFFKENFNAFGQPEISNKNAIVATNISATSYNVGIASTTPLAENEPFLVIPIIATENVQGTMNVVVNTEEKALSYGAAAGISTINSEALVIYPNPTKDIITILDAQGKTVKIIDVQGKEVYNAVLPNAKTEISLKTLGAKGMYVVHILDANNTTIQTKQLILE